VNTPEKRPVKCAMKTCALLVATVTLLTTPSMAQDAKTKATKFWNLTGVEVTKLELAPAGTKDFGPDQCKNDKDGSVDDRERLKIVGVTDGKYDARITDKSGRVCMAFGLDVKAEGVFSVEVEQLKDCNPQ
jgi:hypothetical protein